MSFDKHNKRERLSPVRWSAGSNAAKKKKKKKKKKNTDTKWTRCMESMGWWQH